MFPFFSEEADKVEKDAEYFRQKQKITEKAESNEVNEEDSEEEGAESLENLPYSHGAIDRAQAESRLKDGHIGTYLVRFEIIIFVSNRSSGCHFVCPSDDFMMTS